MICLSKDRRQLLEPEHKELSIRSQCEILGINRSNIYYVRKTIDTELLKLMRVIDEIYMQHPFFGSRQMVSYLKPMGYDIGRSQVRSIYDKLGLRAICPGPHTSKPHREHKIYPYLLKDVEIVARDQVWITDITFVPLRKGFVYLMAIMDWFSRYVLDWDISISLEADFCIETLERLLTHRICEIFNTDQGSQFTSNGFTGLLLAKGIKISMDGRGRAFDNIFVERLWRSVKYECIYLHEWETVREIKHGLIRYFDFYNNERPHQGLGGVTPASVYLNIK